jgi:uncharacterized protein (DUF58 family)
MRIKSLEMRARVVVEGFWKGLHKSPFHGFSVEFSEYRPYTKGDDPRFIDWKVLARSDRVFIKRFEDETNLRCTFLVDQSRSMGFGSRAPTKAEYAATLAATLSCFLMKQGDAVGLATFDETPDQMIPARNRPGHLRRLMVRLEQSPRGTGTDLGAPLDRLAERIRRRGVFVLISDLLAPIDELDRHLGHLAAAGHDLIVFHLLDRAELEFPFDQATHFRDAETGRHLYIDPASAKAGYLAKLEAHLEALRSLCDRNRIEYRLIPTDQPLELALHDFVRARKGSSLQPLRTRNRR